MDLECSPEERTLCALVGIAPFCNSTTICMGCQYGASTQQIRLVLISAPPATCFLAAQEDLIYRASTASQQEVQKIMNRKATLSLALAMVGIAFITQCAQQEQSEQSLQTPTQQEPTVQPLQTPTQQLIIKTGTYFGLCTGYCNEELFINSERVIFLKTSNDPSDEEYPDIIEEVSITSEEWSNLVASVNLDEFNSLPDIAGCPDCADGGGEWIEISAGETTKRVDFEFGASVPEIDNLLKGLRDLREDISSKLDE